MKKIDCLNLRIVYKLLGMRLAMNNLRCVEVA